MGRLTDDIKRLRGEIDDLREMREELIKELVNNTKEIKISVSSLLTDFSKAHADMAISSKNDRAVFVSSVKNFVAGMKKDMQDDLAGARKAWRG